MFIAFDILEACGPKLLNNLVDTLLLAIEIASLHIADDAPGLRLFWGLGFRGCRV